MAARLGGGGFEASSSSESDKVKSTATTFRFTPPSVPLPFVRPPFGAPPLEVDVVVAAAVVDEEEEDVNCCELTAGEERFELVLDDIDALPPPPPPSPLLEESRFVPCLKGSQLPSSDKLMSVTSGLVASTTC